MPTLELLLKSEREEQIERWTVADLHYDLEAGVAVLVVVSPRTRAAIERGGPDEQRRQAMQHCAYVVARRRRV